MRNRATGTAARITMVRWLGGLLVTLLVMMGGAVAASATTPSPSPSSSTSTTIPGNPEKITEGQVCKYIGKNENCLPQIKTMLTTRVECSDGGMVVKIINGTPIKLPFKVDATIDGTSSTKLVWVAANSTLPVQLNMNEGASYKINVEGLLGISWFYEGTRKCQTGGGNDDGANCVSGKVSVSCKHHAINVSLNNPTKHDKTFTVVVKVGSKETTDTVTIPAGTHDSKSFTFEQSDHGKKWSVHITAGDYDKTFSGTLECETPKPPCVEPTDYSVYYDCVKKHLHLEFANPSKEHDLTLKVRVQHPETGEWTPVLPWTIPAGQTAAKHFPFPCKNWKVEVWTDSGWKKVFTVDCSKCNMTSPSPTPSDSTTPSETPSETPSSPAPSSTTTPSGTPSSPAATEPVPTSSAPVVPNNPGGSDTPPPTYPEVPENPGSGLANTGSTGTAVLGSIAALLVIGGGAAVFYTRRQRSS